MCSSDLTSTRFRKQVDVSDDLWMSVLEATGQPAAWDDVQPVAE